MAIVKRGENKYLIRVYLGRDTITKRRLEVNETFYGSYEDAEKREQILKDKAKEGNITKSSRMTVKQLVEFYLDSTRRSRGQTRQRFLRYALERYVLPYIGNLQITKIKKSDIQRLLNFLLDSKKEDKSDGQKERGTPIRTRPRGKYS